jgi:hypothetical protein
MECDQSVFLGRIHDAAPVARERAMIEEVLGMPLSDVPLWAFALILIVVVIALRAEDEGCGCLLVLILGAFFMLLLA